MKNVSIPVIMCVLGFFGGIFLVELQHTTIEEDQHRDLDSKIAIIKKEIEIEEKKEKLRGLRVHLELTKKYNREAGL